MSSSAPPPLDEDLRVPPYLSSGAVAVITVISVLLTAGLLVAAYFLFTSWRLKNKLQRGTSPQRFEEVREEEDVPQAERLREDTVLVHDVVFHDDGLYTVQPGDKPQPSPAPSVALLHEILSSVADMRQTEERSSPVSGIIDDVIENIVVHASELEAQTEEAEGGRLLVRNESYHRAIEDDEHNQGMFGEFSVPEEFSQNNPFRPFFSGSDGATAGNSDQVELSQFSSQSEEMNASVTSLEASPGLGSIDDGECEIQGKYHSTPILDGPQCGESVPVFQSRYLSYRNLDSAEKESYIPVYTRPFPSFIKPSNEK